MAQTRRAKFIEENGPFRPKGELVVAPDPKSGTLVSLIDPDNPPYNPYPQPADVPETITLEENPVLPEDVMRAFADIIKNFGKKGRLQGIAQMDEMTPDNKFRTQVDHPDDAMDWIEANIDYYEAPVKPIHNQSDDTGETPAQEAGFDDTVDFLKSLMGPDVKEIPAEVIAALKQTGKQIIDVTEAAYDTLNNTKARLAAGENPAKVRASREYIKLQLEELLKTVPEHEVGTGDIPKKRMNAKIREKMLKNPQMVRDLLDPIILRSR